MRVIWQKRLNFIVLPKRHLRFSVYCTLSVKISLACKRCLTLQTSSMQPKSNDPWLTWRCLDLVDEPFMVFDPKYTQIM